MLGNTSVIRSSNNNYEVRTKEFLLSLWMDFLMKLLYQRQMSLGNISHWVNGLAMLFSISSLYTRKITFFNYIFSMLSRSHIILIYSLIVCVLLYITENIYHPVYTIQMLQKVVSFLVMPLILGYIWKYRVGRAGKMGRTSVIYGVSLGLVSMVVIGVTYMLLSDMLDWSAIGASMEARGITETTFILVFIYIMFGNSLLEEYFFRGIVHYNMLGISRVGAYVLSALMFSLYHITIFGTWFSGWILGLALFWLIAWWVFFSWLYQKTWGIWSAWIFHIFADLMILIIGYREFFL